MSDDSSAQRGRYAQPRRRRHAQKTRQRDDQPAFEQAVEDQDPYDDRGSAQSGAQGDYDAYDRLGDTDREQDGLGAYDEAPVRGADAYADDLYEDDDDLEDYEDPRSEMSLADRPADDGYEHDYLDRESAQSNFSPEVDPRDFPARDEYEEERADTGYPTPAAARDYDEQTYERRPLRDRSLPPPPEDGALVGPQSDLGDEANLIVSGIGKSYKRRPVVRDVSLQVRRGEIVGLLGPNGAGKTTCFYMITGLVPADRGSIQLMGQDLTRLPMYQRARMGLSYLPQEVSIFRGMTVEQNIRAILELSEPAGHRREARLDQLLAEFSISRLRNSPAVALSGGERRRVEIARCLAANPAFILLDEPFAGVDPIAVGDIRSLVWQLKDRGIGVLITDHNVRETLEIIDRAYILHDGRVLMEGAPEDVINDENVRRVYLGEGFRI